MKWLNILHTKAVSSAVGSNCALVTINLDKLTTVFSTVFSYSYNLFELHYFTAREYENNFVHERRFRNYGAG